MAIDDMVVDLEKRTDEIMDAADAQLPAMAGGGEKELPAPDLRHLLPFEGATAAGRMNPSQMKWLAYFLLVAAASVILLDNHVNAAPQDQLFPPGLGMFAVLLGAICLIFRAMKQTA